jgi:hypothetical protein
LRELAEKKDRVFKEQEALDEKQRKIKDLEAQHKALDRELDDLRATVSRIGKATAHQKSLDQEIIGQCGMVEAAIR